MCLSSTRLGEELIFPPQRLALSPQTSRRPCLQCQLPPDPRALASRPSQELPAHCTKARVFKAQLPPRHFDPFLPHHETILPKVALHCTPNPYCGRAIWHCGPGTHDSSPSVRQPTTLRAPVVAQTGASMPNLPGVWWEIRTLLLSHPYLNPPSSLLSHLYLYPLRAHTRARLVFHDGAPPRQPNIQDSESPCSEKTGVAASPS